VRLARQLLEPVDGRLEVAGFGLGLAGVLMLTQGAGFQASPAGLAAISIACVTWSLGSVLSQRALPLAPGATGFASEMLCGGAVLMAMSAVHGYLSGAVRKFADDRNQKPARHWRVVNEIPTLLMVVIVILVIVKPF